MSHLARTRLELSFAFEAYPLAFPLEAGEPKSQHTFHRPTRSPLPRCSTIHRLSSSAHRHVLPELKPHPSTIKLQTPCLSFLKLHISSPTNAVSPSFSLLLLCSILFPRWDIIPTSPPIHHLMYFSNLSIRSGNLILSRFGLGC